ncbi:hypothetical protein ACA910_004274 [Epithemia clementina (nom. ined.)]
MWKRLAASGSSRGGRTAVGDKHKNEGATGKQARRYRNRTKIISLLVLVWLTASGVVYQVPTTIVEQPRKSQFILPKKEMKNNANFFSSTSCGIQWTNLVKQNQPRINHNNQVSSSPSLTVWTVSGGPEYRSFLHVLLKKWETLLGMKIIVIALDKETASRSCELGYHAVFWDSPAASYSKVADAKFQVSAHLAAHGVNQLFVELDVFCRLSPLPLFLDKKYHQQEPVVASTPDLVLTGHLDVDTKINIGMYYVKASRKTAIFFQTLTELLRPSLTEPMYIRGLQGSQRETKREYFDQQVFQDCLMLPRPPVKYFALNDTSRVNDLLRICADKEMIDDQQQNISWAIIPTTYLSNFRPPAVYDSSYCIHPLAMQPLSTFRTKLATAKFLGFDPVSAADDTRPMLKTVSGELLFNWRTGFRVHELAEEKIRRQKIQYPIALLVALAWKTKRVLVLPRHVRSKDTTEYPIFSLVSTTSIEQWVPWRFLTPLEAWHFEEENATRFVETPSSKFEGDAMEELAEKCKGDSAQVCSIHGLYRLRFPKGSPNSLLVEQIIQNLTWCLKPPKLANGTSRGYQFTFGSGHFEHPCEEPGLRKRKPPNKTMP